MVALYALYVRPPQQIDSQGAESKLADRISRAQDAFHGRHILQDAFQRLGIGVNVRDESYPHASLSLSQQGIARMAVAPVCPAGGERLQELLEVHGRLRS